MSDVYRILYCSRNFIEEDHREAEISQILASARANNGKKDVTGALLYNSGCFAQVLEGPRPAIEQIFEKIQRDHRHGEVTVLESGNASARNFPEWSMAHVSPPSLLESAEVASTLDEALLHPADASSEVLSLLRNLVIQDD